MNFTASEDFFLNGAGVGVAFGNGLWVAVGYGPAGSIAYSEDGGEVWQAANSLFDGGPGGRGVAYGQDTGVWVAVGGAGMPITVGVSATGRLFTTVVGRVWPGLQPSEIPLLPMVRNQL